MPTAASISATGAEYRQQQHVESPARHRFGKKLSHSLYVGDGQVLIDLLNLIFD